MASKPARGEISYNLEGFEAKRLPTRKTASESRRSPTDSDNMTLESALGQAGFTVVESVLIEADHSRLDELRRSSSPPSLDLAVPVSSMESAIILIESDGLFFWEKSNFRSEIPETRRSDDRSELLYFDLASTTGTENSASTESPEQQEDTRRGPVVDWLKDKVADKIIVRVLRFLVTRTIDTAIKLIEEGNPTGAVLVDGDNPDDWVPGSASNISINQPARILLLVHGTFSSTAGSFGGLAGTNEGLHFLSEARKKYDLILGFDHKTLVDNPEENAEQILSFLLSLQLPPDTVIDAIAFSRGGLVFRTLSELLIPNSALQVKMGKAIFVGCPNAGTHLTKPENWSDLANLYTNLFLAGMQGVSLMASGGIASPLAVTTIKTIGRFVQLLSEVAVGEAYVPGLAAMEPGGAFVAGLNAIKRPDGNSASYHAVTSDFEPAGSDSQSLPTKLKKYLADRVVDRLFQTSNDCVVDTASMTEFGSWNSALDSGEVFDFPQEDEIFHTVYFASTRTAEVLTEWLGLLPLVHLDTGSDEEKAAMSPQPDVRRNVHGHADGTTEGEVEEQAADEEVEEYGGIVPAGMEPDSRRDMADEDTSPMVTPIAIDSDNLEKIAGSIDISDIMGRFQGAPRRRGISPSDFTLGYSGEATSKPSITPFSVPSLGTPDAAPVDIAGGDTLPGGGRETPAPPGSDERYFSASMDANPIFDRMVPVNLYVTQHIAALPDGDVAASDPEPKGVDVNEPIMVVITPLENCKVIGPMEIELQAGIINGSATFFVQAEKLGEAELRLEARQNGQTLASFTLKPHFQLEGSPPLYGYAPLEAPTSSKEHPILRISEYRGADGNITLIYDFSSPDPRASFYERVNLPDIGRLEDYVAGIYDEIDEAYNLDPGSYDIFLQQFIRRAIKRTKDLVPENIRNWLWENKDNVYAIQVITNEPYIPWELLYIANPNDRKAKRDHSGFLSQWGIVRWFHGVPVPGEGLSLEANRSFHVIPDGQRLKGADAERQLLENDLFPGMRAIPSKNVEILEFLIEGAKDCDVLHFACHGKASVKNIEDSRLILGTQLKNRDGSPRFRMDGDNKRPVYETLDYASVEVEAEFASEGPSALVFLNSCQTGQGGYELIGNSGFAKAFLAPESGKGASVFVGALWSIVDRLSKIFADTFYRRLLDGDTLVEAVKAARDACHDKSDFTWLAFTVYGNPCARIGKKEEK